MDCTNIKIIGICQLIFIFTIFIIILFSSFPYTNLYAHNEIQIGNYTISAGWKTEPPLLNILNNIIIEVTKNDDTSVRNALLNTIIDIKFGGLTKELSFISSEESSSIYESPIIPKSLGSYSIEINGLIENQKTVGIIQLEDVEDPIKISFPNIDNRNTLVEENKETNLIGNEIKTVVKKLSSDVEKIKNDVNNTKNTLKESIKATTKLLNEVDKAYLLGFIGLSLGIVSVTLLISKRIREVRE